MLKLKKVQILGFKSFCDRTEVQLSGEGIAAIVGPNGCGKSNISDAITWVLGEQSAKSLRGIKMEDVIFAGTRERKPTGMAEVSLTLVDPDVYDGVNLQDDSDSDVVSIDSAHVSDWDETSFRQQRAIETEEAVAEAQPGTVLEGEAIAIAAEASAEADAETANAANPNNVVLKIRRRKFGRAPVRAGELTITRRLFRTGDSEYLLNGKICRLRDIQDIFMGTGLGGESYAIIGQERIGQLLSSKPLDRRGIIEEAAGITRFKTKKRLAELRLEAAKQNLSRVNDIFDEVTKQMGTLKRQAAKAERYGALRDELRTKLRVALASRMAQLDTEAAAAAAEIARLGSVIDAHAADLETMDADHTEGVRNGYTLDAQIREAGTVANQSAVELERITARTASNADRIAELTNRLASGGEELEAARLQLAQLAGEQEQHRSFLETATAESTGSRETAQTQQQAAQNAIRALAQAEQQAENNRRNGMSLLQRASQTRNEEAQAAAALAGLERESERLLSESEIAKQELTQLGLERGQVKMSFESVTERLQRLEAEIAALRLEIEGSRNAEAQSKKRGDQLRGEQATLMGRRNSLEALIREHSYSTDTVKNLFRAKPAAGAGELAPMGTLADFLEVDGKYESIVDEFLRDELNYVVVKSWDAAGEGLRLLQKDVAGRATFLIHTDEPVGFAHGMSGENQPSGEGIVALKDCIRVRNGFGRSLEVILPRLRDGYVAPDAEGARAMALAYPHAFFLAPNGEMFHNVTVTGGRTRAQGPLALKRELNEVQQKVDAVAAELAATDTKTAELQHQIAAHSGTLDGKSLERRDAEREAANSGAALRQMDSEAQRIERRLQDWQLSSERNRDQKTQKIDLIARLQESASQLDTERATLEAGLADLQQQLGDLRVQRELLQQAAAEAAAALAGLEERRRNAAANLEQTTRLFNTQNARIQQLDQQLTQAGAEKLRREEETAALAQQHEQLSEARAVAVANGVRISAEAAELRTKMTELDQRLRTLRHETEELREQRAGLSARAAKLASDIEHIEATCLNDLGVEAALLRADAGIERIEGDALTLQEEESRALKQRLEAMGPVNMMALEEYNETAERHAFMEGQRKDLMESIENTQASIKEIDDVSRIKFDEAFKIINDNFSVTFTKLFGGGQAFMKLTDIENANESGIDIVASPPGKKLQNILLLSGGEKALTALSLLVGIFQFQPAPFCVLDEVDAPLDETNVGRFAKLIAEMSATTQFVVITHSKRTMSQADVIYGVTMQEPGVSKIVSVALGKGNRNEQDRRAVA